MPLTLGLASSLIFVRAWLVPPLSQVILTPDATTETAWKITVTSRPVAPDPMVRLELSREVAPAVCVVDVAVASIVRAMPWPDYVSSAINAVTAGIKFVACEAVNVSQVSPVVSE